jgi:hypothetical protein
MSGVVTLNGIVEPGHIQNDPPRTGILGLEHVLAQANHFLSGTKPLAIVSHEDPYSLT